MRVRRAVAATGLAVALTAWIARRLPDFRPFNLLLSRTSLLPPDTRARAQKRLFKGLYFVVNRTLEASDVGFLNYGYTPLDGSEPIDVPAGSEEDRYSIQLYDRVAGGADLHGLDVLEIGCGRGGGATFVFEQHGPATMTGLDLSAPAVEHARRRYGRRGLEFVVGDAESVPFADASFDAVLNVESSHCYPDVPRFLAEVGRVLRPGGVFLFADLRATRINDAGADPRREDVRKLHEQLAAAGMAVVEEEDITANVVRALEADSDRRRALIERKAPRLIQSQLLNFSGVVGSATYESFATRELSYLRVVVRTDAGTSAP